MKKLLLFTFCNIFLLNVFGQTLIIQIDHVSPYPITYPCPNDVHGYKIRIINDKDGYHSNSPWKIENGDIVSGGGRNQDYCTIMWHDKTQGTITIDTIKIVDGGYSWSAYNQQFTIPVRSLKGITPSEITGQNTVEVNNSTSLTFTSSIIKYPTDEVVSYYSWQLPPNWVSNGVTSNGSNIYTTATTNIIVTPDICTGGEIKVWAKNAKCDINLTESNKKIFQITRIWPNYIITGSNLLCDTEEYSISNLPSNVTVQWSCSSNIQLISNSNANPATFVRNGISGAGWIKATLSLNICSIESKIITKNIWVGTPAVYAFGNHLVDALTGMTIYDFCYGTYNDCRAVHTAGEAYIDQWQWQGTAATIYPYGSSYQYATIYPSDYSSFGIEIRAHNECGWSEWARMWVIAVDCSSYFLIISPNPADSFVELSIIDGKDIKNDDNIIEIKKNKKNKGENIEDYLIQIFDKKGIIRKSIQSNLKNIHISTDDLEPDNYFVHFTYAGIVYKQQIIIN